MHFFSQFDAVVEMNLSEYYIIHNLMQTTLKAMVQATSERGNKEITIPQFPSESTLVNLPLWHNVWPSQPFYSMH